MTKFKFAFVNFFKERRGRRVVDVEDIADFSPQYHADFDEEKIYDVKWDHFPTEGSASTQGFYDAKILCIGVSMEDLEHEAKINGLKIPKYDADVTKVDKESQNGHSKKSSKGRTLKPANCKETVQEKSEPDPRMKKKKKPTVEDKSREKRHTKMLDSYKDLVQEQSKDSSEHDTSLQKAAMKKLDSTSKSPGSDLWNMEESFLMSVPTKSLGATYGNHSSLKKPTSSPIVSPNQNKLPKSRFTPKKDKSPLKLPKSPLKLPKSPLKLPKSPMKLPKSPLKLPKSPLKLPKIPLKPGDSLSQPSPLKREKSFPMQELSPLEKVNSFPNSDKPSSQHGSFDEDSYTLNRSENLPSMNHSDDSFKVEPYYSSKKSSPLRYSLRKSGENQKRAESSDSDTGTSTVYVSTDEERDLYRRKTMTLENEFKTLKSKYYQLTEELASSKELVASLQEKLSRYEVINMKLQERLLDMPRNKTVDSESAIMGTSPKTPTTSSNKAQKKLSFDNGDSVPTPRSDDQDKDKRVKKEKGTSLKRKSDPREDNVTDNKDLAPMIISALKSKSPLQSDGNGKVHLGNGVWVSETLWKDKLRKPTFTPNIAIRDAMGHIYEVEELAQRSLEGGTPVKASSSGDKRKKMKMTPCKREAVLALYRAKTAVNTGSQDANFLDLAVAGKGRDTIRYKLKEAAKSQEKLQLRKEKAMTPDNEEAILDD